MFMGASVDLAGMDIGIFMGIDMFMGIFIGIFIGMLIGMLIGMVMLFEMDLLSNMVMVLISETVVLSEIVMFSKMVLLSCWITITDTGIPSGVMLADIDSLDDIVMFSSDDRATPKESIKRTDANIVPINIETFIFLSSDLF
jgi:hypothetical protein